MAPQPWHALTCVKLRRGVITQRHNAVMNVLCGAMVSFVVWSQTLYLFLSLWLLFLWLSLCGFDSKVLAPVLTVVVVVVFVCHIFLVFGF